MLFSDTDVADAKLIAPDCHEDNRGRFFRAWCAREFAEHGIKFSPVQANIAYSRQKGTIRGMHYQEDPAVEAKLVRCTRGAIYDVVVDLRRESLTYGKWYAGELSADNGRMLFVPEGCAHGCQTLKDDTEIYYMTSQFYTPTAVRGVRFDDPVFGISWPLPVAVVSEQDRCWPLVNL